MVSGRIPLQSRFPEAAQTQMERNKQKLCKLSPILLGVIPDEADIHELQEYEELTGYLRNALNVLLQFAEKKIYFSRLHIRKQCLHCLQAGPVMTPGKT